MVSLKGELNKNVKLSEIKESIRRSGGISGAIADPLSREARNHAKLFYEEIRHRTDDVVKIANYTGYTPEQILKVKNYLFIDTHILSDGIRQFDPSFEISESWQRLSDMQEYVQEHDKLLIPHELKEMEYINSGLNQEDAHEKTCLEYNYPRATRDFYENLRKMEKARIDKVDSISGGIEHRQRTNDDWCHIL